MTAAINYQLISLKSAATATHGSLSTPRTTESTKTLATTVIKTSTSGTTPTEKIGATTATKVSTSITASPLLTDNVPVASQ